ncbi:protein bric-a-brac 1-like isoform X2 [Planococcus citri]|uniref:protein bric-a-brac 1-like isoform X2 n=1 Tax=Planococcus citri TaxID=170843 RepID=UPI0031F9AC96
MENSMIASSEGGDETQPAVGNNHSHSHSHGGGGPCGGGDEQTPQLFCLRWNNYQSNLTNVFDQLLQNESFVDVTLACADGHTVKAHKMVLSACSPYFQALFFENPCKHPIVILKDIKWTELKAAVEFMYKGEINVCQEQIAPLLKVAESLKIRGLADVSNEHDFAQRDSKSPTSAAETVARSPSRSNSSANSGQPPSKKRRRASADRSSTSTGEDTISVINSPSRALELVTSPSSSSIGTTSICNGMTSTHNASSTSCSQQQQQQQHQQQQSQSQAGRPSQSSTPQSPSNMAPLPIPPPPPTLPSTSSVADDMEIKPGIAEMIREEERAKMLESSQAWLNASTSLASDSYQYQLQSMWQKCWNTNQSLVHNLRFRERGPLKSWRPETMAEAILSVLKEGLSLSQAARKYDIPYPTFVLYANRVHNMLGPSVDGGSDLRPKGRGRPQRILLGYWPEDHIQNVIRAVVFRDPQHIKDEPLNLGYPRISCFQEPLNMYGNNNSCLNSPEPPVSPNSTAAVIAMAQGLRQQVLAAAAAHSNNDNNFGFFSSQCANGSPSLLMATPLQSPNSTPPASPVSNENLEVGIGVTGVPFKSTDNFPVKSEILFNDEIEDLVMKSPHSRTPTSSADQPKPLPLVLEQRSD